MALPSIVTAAIARIRAANGNAYDPDTNPGGLAQGGHRQNFVPDLNAVADLGEFVADRAEASDTNAALTAEDASNTVLDRIATAENVTLAADQVVLATEQKTLAALWADAPENTPVESGKFSSRHWAAKAAALAAGISLPAISVANALQFLRVKADGSGYETAVVDATPNIPRVARTSNTALAKADQGKLIDITSGTFTQTFAAAATLGAGWWCYLRNSGTGTITLDPNGSETIDGLSTYDLVAGETVLVQCTGTAFFATMKPTGLGYGQTWQDVTRSSGTSYRNTTGKPIAIAAAAASGAVIQISSNNSTWIDLAFPYASSSVFAIIPNNLYYRLSLSGTVSFIRELR